MADAIAATRSCDGEGEAGTVVSLDALLNRGLLRRASSLSGRLRIEGGARKGLLFFADDTANDGPAQGVY